MTFGARKFDTLEVELSVDARALAAGNGKRLKEIERNTHALVAYVLQSAASDESLGEYDFSLVDADATITLSRNRGGIPEKGPLLDMLLTHGRSGETIIARLLEREEDPNRPYVSPTSRVVRGTTPLMWVAYKKASDTVDYLTPFIADERVDLETPSPQTGMSLLSSFCQHVMVQGDTGHMAVVSAGALPIDAMQPAARRHIHRLLLRDAVLDPFYVQADSLADQQTPEQKAALTRLASQILAPFVRQWQKEWDQFVQGETQPDTLTQQEFNHFFSLGKVPEILTSGRWDGYESALWQHLQNLPEWAKARYPYHEEVHQLLARMEPQSTIETPDHWEPLLAPQQGKGAA